MAFVGRWANFFELSEDFRFAFSSGTGAAFDVENFFGFGNGHKMAEANVSVIPLGGFGNGLQANERAE